MKGERQFEMRRLRLAFSEMRRYGILAEEDFLCCQNCGAHAMQKRAAEKFPEDAQPIGYCFFHGQDTDILIEEGRTMLAFNGFGPVDSYPVGNIIVDCLRRAGIRCMWNGDVTKRIEFWLARKPRKVVAKA